MLQESMRSTIKMRIKLTKILIVITLPACLAGQVTAGSTTFKDITFNIIDWSEAVFSSSPESTHSVGQISHNGNPGSFRYMEHILPPSTSAGKEEGIAVVHFYLPGTYDPRKQGAINWISYQEDYIIFNPRAGASVFTELALIQDGKVFFAGRTEIRNTKWSKLSVNALTAIDFVSDDGSSSNPDFSSTGSAMQFGFRRKHTGINGYDMFHGIDNWTVTISSLKPVVPHPTTPVISLSSGKGALSE